MYKSAPNPPNIPALQDDQQQAKSVDEPSFSVRDDTNLKDQQCR